MIRRRPVDAAAFALAAAGTVLLAADQGGFFERTWAPATLAFAAAAALALVLLDDLRASRGAVVLVVGLASVAGWTACSAIWSPAPHASLEEAERALVYVAMALALGAVAAAGTSAALLAGLVVGVFGLTCYSLLDRLIRGAHAADAQGSLLEHPLGYANALGALCAIALAIALMLAWADRRPVALVSAAAAAAVLGAALVLTQSRGSWIALAVGVALGLAAERGRRMTAAAAATLGLALAALSAVAAFTTPAALQARGAYWHAAWQAIERHPFVGTGAGTFDRTWIESGDLVRWKVALDAHSLYLETLAELGIVGLALVLVALVAPLVAGRGSAALAGATAFLVHAGLDWDWEMPAVTVAGLVCVAAALERRPEPLGRRARELELAAAVALAAFGAAQVFARSGLL